MKFIASLLLFIANVSLTAFILAYSWNTFLLPYAPVLNPIHPVAAYALSVSLSAAEATHRIRAAAAQESVLPESPSYYSGVSLATKIFLLLILYVLSFFI